MNITVVGTGYVGLVTAAGFAGFGHHVTALDINEDRIHRLLRGELPFFEPGLAERVHQHTQHAQLRFTTSYDVAVRDAAVIFLCVGTPGTPGGAADLHFVYDAARMVGVALVAMRAVDLASAKQAPGILVVSKSTVPPGTTQKIRNVLIEAGLTPSVDFEVVANPEFLREGTAVLDFDKPERVVVGFRQPPPLWAAHRIFELYRPIVLDPGRILDMSAESAELAKYASNAMLATRISFMNELAVYAEAIGADIKHVQRAVATDSRIGSQYLHAGCGWGGSCFGKDVHALVMAAEARGCVLNVAGAALSTNHAQKGLLARKIQQHFGGDIHGKTLAVWGLAFKPDTDDVRDAPALTLVDELLRRGARVRVYDPRATQPFLDALVRMGCELVDVHCALDPYEAAHGADALVLVTEWHVFRAPDFSRLKTDLAAPVLFDGRNVWDPRTVREVGFTYYGIGRS